MKRARKRWMQFSLKKKLIAILIGVIVIITISEGLTMLITQSSFREFEEIMENNAIYHELQEVIKKEQETFITYSRDRTEDNKIAFETACSESEKCIERLPFDYSRLGEERYARTWNLLNGYEGYKEYRNRILNKSESDPDYIEELYEVLGMQDNLSTYALRLVQVTTDQWNSVYEVKMRTLRMIPWLIAGVTCVMIVLAYRIWKLLAATMIKPVFMLSQDSRRMAKNDFNTPDLQVENEDEIGELVQAFNKMKRAMQSYITTLKEKKQMAELLHKEELEKVEMEKNLERARLEILKHQVNPHFLFNTLNMISSMAKLEEAKTTDKMIISLGNLFRYNLRTVEQKVCLEQEIQVVEDYIYIQQMRFDHRIGYEKEVMIDETKVKIPSFTLQPIIENAFIHGLFSKEEGGRILLKIQERDGIVTITVADNGCGMDEEMLAELNRKIHRTNTSGRGIGLGNICRRIDMMYPDGSFRIFSKKGKGTVVKMEIPQREGEDG
ncbi:MAG: sensor histidine kinase [Dorea sp.]